MPDLAWVRRPQQGRSQRTLQALLDAAEALLEERSFEEASVQAICDRAGCSVGAFYGRFPSKQDLLRALYARYRDDSLATLETLRPGEPLTDTIAAIIRFVVADYRARPGLRRAFQQAVAVDPEIRAMAVDVSVATCAAVASVLRAAGVDAPDAAAEMLHRVVFGVLDQDLLYPDGPLGRPTAEEQLTAGLVAVATRYLGVSP